MADSKRRGACGACEGRLLDHIQVPNRPAGWRASRSPYKPVPSQKERNENDSVPVDETTPPWVKRDL